MAAFVNKTTLKYIKQGHTPDYLPGTAATGIDPDDWIILGRGGRDMTEEERRVLTTVEQKYRKLDGGFVAEMTQAEKDAVDAALIAERKAERKAAEEQRIARDDVVLLALVRTLAQLFPNETPTTIRQRIRTNIQNIIDAER